MHQLGTSWGETETERASRYPCDDLIPAPDQAAFRAIDVGAPPLLMWRWLCQLRIAPYSYDWIDNWGRRSPRELTPGLDRLVLGQRALSFFEVAAFETGRSITLYAEKSVFGELAVSYCIAPKPDDRCRITVKLVVVYPHGIGRVMRHVPPVGDLIMMRKQLRTLKRLAERDHARAADEAFDVVRSRRDSQVDG
jgi:hypothetical protein